jgi:spermidine synthase
VVTQSLLLREALVLMFGSELAWGIVLFAWLLGVAVGAALGGRLTARTSRPELILVIALLTLSLITCADLWIFRGIRSWLSPAAAGEPWIGRMLGGIPAWLRLEPGELIPLPVMALLAVVFIPLTSALVGFSFPAACAIRPVRGDMSVSLMSFGDVYALESAGSLIGGAAFSFWAVEHLAPIQTALYCGALTAAAGAAVAAWNSPRWERRLFSGFLGLLAAVAVLLAAVDGTLLNARLVERRWRGIAPGYQLCAEAESRYQNLSLGRREQQYTLYCNGQIATGFPDPYSFVPLAHLWMCQHPAPRRMLVLGGGAEGLLAEILRHPVEHVDYVEPDPRQVELIMPYLPEVDRQALADPRVTMWHVDARYFVKTQRNKFDLVIARLPEPTSALRARFYTDEFYRELRRAMTEQSVLCTTVAASPGELSPASAEFIASIRATMRRHFPQIVVCWGDPAHVLAATAKGLVSLDPPELVRRYAGRGVHSEMFDPLWFEGATDMLDPDKVQRRAEELDAAANVCISTDLHPVVYMQRLVLWERMTSGAAGGFIERLRAVRLTGLVTALAVLGAATLLFCRLRGSRGATSHPADLAALPPRAGPWASGVITLSVASTGFATMALSIIWLFAFQNCYGYVYQRIGWIIALFMGGLVVGSWATGRRAKRAAPARSWGDLIVVDLLIAALAGVVPFVLRGLGGLQTSETALVLVESTVSVAVAVTGVLCGAAFPLAGALQTLLREQGRLPSVATRPSSAGIRGAIDSSAAPAIDRSASAVAGSVVGADHAGACLGALLTGILLVPVFGTAAAAFVLAGMKLVSAGLLAVVRPRHDEPRTSDLPTDRS